MFLNLHTIHSMDHQKRLTLAHETNRASLEWHSFLRFQLTAYFQNQPGPQTILILKGNGKKQSSIMAYFKELSEPKQHNLLLEKALCIQGLDCFENVFSQGISIIHFQKSKKWLLQYIPLESRLDYASCGSSETKQYFILLVFEF